MAKRKISKEAQASLDRLNTKSSVEIKSEQDVLSEFGVDNLDQLQKTTDIDRKEIAETINFYPVEGKNAMSEKAFKEALRTAYVSDKPIIYVRSSYQPNWGIDFIDLSYLDKDSNKIVGLSRIPLFYRDLYSHAYGMENFVLFCHEKNVDAILNMLKQDRDIIIRKEKNKKAKREAIDRAISNMDDSVVER